jgi:hypothetical protein
MHIKSMLLLGFATAVLPSLPAAAATFNFSTGGPDGRIATAAGTDPGSGIETETADDFVLGQRTRLTGGSFTGLLPTGDILAGVTSIKIELYRVFPGDSANPPSGRVPTRVNSPADVDFVERDSSAGELLFDLTPLNPAFAAANSVIDGIFTAPNQFTGGEGAVTGQEIRLDFRFAEALTLDAGQYFFVPQVQTTNGSFLWLSAAKPIVAPGTPFTPDLQSWIRNEALQPDWLRIGTDITGQGPFNASFALTGSTVPEPASWALLMIGFGLVGAVMRRRKMAVTAA